MKLGEVPEEKLDSVTDAERTRIIYGGLRPVPEGRGVAVAALLLGCGAPHAMAQRAAAAASLYREGLVRCVIPTGGVLHPTERGEMTEAGYMTLRLRESGVPDDAIIVEGKALTTIENMLYGALEIEKAFHPPGPHGVYVVTSAWHMRRSLALAANFLPQTARIFCRASEGVPDEPRRWMDDEYLKDRVNRELRVTRRFIGRGLIPDIEF